MSKILGNKQTIEYARRAGGMTKDVHVNWDAIDQLPDEFEVVITSIEYDPTNLAASFYDIGQGMFLPRPELMYDIAKACGVQGSDESENEPVLDEVDYSRLTSPGKFDAPADLRKIKVGHKVSKSSIVLTEDGTTRRSSTCTVVYNVWDRCLELWTKEEKFTDGYQKKGRYDNKYQSPYDRQAHFAADMKFAAAKAETKAHEKTIRELAGLMTGYKSTDLTSGKLVFSRVQRSRGVLKMETAARLTAISSGSDKPAKAAGALFGPEAEQAALPPAAPPSFDIEEPEPEDVTPERKNWEILRDTAAVYLATGLVSEPNEVGTLTSIVGWLEKEKERAESTERWADALSWLFYVEDTYIGDKAIDHGFQRP